MRTIHPVKLLTWRMKRTWTRNVHVNKWLGFSAIKYILSSYIWSSRCKAGISNMSVYSLCFAWNRNPNISISANLLEDAWNILLCYRLSVAQITHQGKWFYVKLYVFRRLLKVSLSNGATEIWRTPDNRQQENTFGRKSENHIFKFTCAFSSCPCSEEFVHNCIAKIIRNVFWSSIPTSGL